MIITMTMIIIIATIIIIIIIIMVTTTTNSKKNLMDGSNIVGAVQLNLLYYHLFECTGNSA